MRSSVDFPQPERPSRPTISRSRSNMFTLSMTTRSAPEGRGKAWRTLRTSIKVCPAAMRRLLSVSVEAEAPLGHAVKRAPEYPVEQDDINRHHGDPQDDMGEIAGIGRGGDIGAESMGLQMGVTPAHILGDDAGVPAAARGCHRPSDVIGEDPGQNDLAPPLPAADPEIRRRIPEVVGIDAGP